MNGASVIPFTGWPTDEVYSKLKKMIEKEGGVTVFILDEVDKLKGDEALYNLSRINTELTGAKVSIVGLSNDFKVYRIFRSACKI